MRDLIGRVAVADRGTATALRVIAHFDTLTERGASTAAILRAAAALAGTSAALHDGTTGHTTRVDPSGQPLPPGESPADPNWPRITIDSAGATSVWLERTDGPRPLDQLVVERCAHALRPKLTTPTDLPADSAVRIACDRAVTTGEREEALAMLGLSAPLTVIATPTPPGPPLLAQAFADDTWTLLVRGETSDQGLPSQCRVGSAIAEATDNVPDALDHARQSLAVTVDPGCGGPTHSRYEDLGSIATLAQTITPDQAAESPDVLTLQALRSRHPWVPATFYYVLAEVSLRQAAQALHLHHSTLQQRLDWMHVQLGYSPRTAEGRLRAATAWMLWRISGHLHQPA